MSLIIILQLSALTIKFLILTHTSYLNTPIESTFNFDLRGKEIGGTRYLCDKNEPALDRFSGGCTVSPAGS